MRPVIKIDNLSKRYIIRHESPGRQHVTFREEATQWVKRKGSRLFNPKSGIQSSNKEEFWALKDISFEVLHGERIGVIGRNGAGKSTLLKILSRVTEPTTGKISIKGRVASLLEVGTGFHPELTGRENIYLNGSILGMSNMEIKGKFDEIVAFSEIERFLDTPVKRYSSGMYVRLAFAVAAHLEPEILIVDEVLAVGDAAFQKKCLGKMEDVSKSEGRTVLFVSHNMAAITSLCEKCILLQQGELVRNDRTSDVVLSYYSSTGSMTPSFVDYRATQNNAHEDDIAVLLQGSIVSETGKNISEATIHDSFLVKMRFQIKKETAGLHVPNYHFFTADGSCAFVDNSTNVKRVKPGIYEASGRVPGNLLNEGAYTIGLALTTYYENGMQVNFFDKFALSINIKDPMDDRSNRYGYAGPIPGAVRPNLSWTIVEV